MIGCKAMMRSLGYTHRVNHTCTNAPGQAADVDVQNNRGHTPCSRPPFFLSSIINEVLVHSSVTLLHVLSEGVHAIYVHFDTPQVLALRSKVLVPLRARTAAQKACSTPLYLADSIRDTASRCNSTELRQTLQLHSSGDTMQEHATGILSAFLSFE